MAKQIVFRSRIKRARGIAKDAWETGIRSITAEVKAEWQDLVDTPHPPASKPLQPPHRRSGKFQKGLTVTVEKASRGRAAQIVMKSNQPYGSWLEEGTVNMTKRPSAQVVLTGGRRKIKMKKKWMDKIARKAKTKASRSTRKTTGNRRRR